MRASKHSLIRFYERTGRRIDEENLIRAVQRGGTLSTWEGNRAILLRGHDVVAVVTGDVIVTILTVEHHRRNMEKVAIGLAKDPKRRRRKR